MDTKDANLLLYPKPEQNGGLPKYTPTKPMMNDAKAFCEIPERLKEKF
jgi:hypothetical protein